jgi:hypothetical protein
LSSASWLGLWSKITSTYFFPFVHRNMGLKQIVHWGPLESAWILHHFQQKGIDISNLVTNVVRLDCETTQELRMKERNTTLDSFRKLLTNCVLIYEGPWLPSCYTSLFRSTSRQVFRRNGPHVGVWWTRHQYLFPRNQDGHVWTQILL